ncbi:unnamed protein product, partial [Nesidiocoris tenuis]
MMFHHFVMIDGLTRPRQLSFSRVRNKIQKFLEGSILDYHMNLQTVRRAGNG